MTITAATHSPQALRRLLRNRRRSLTPLQQKIAAKNLYKQVIHHPLFRKAQHIGLYLANDGEIDPNLLLKAAQRYKKTIYLPILQRWPKFAMAFQRITPETRWTLNRFNIKQPVANFSHQVKPVKLDLILMPLVGFDEYGGRLGMGGGFYDRYLSYLKNRKSWHKPYLLGLAHECQKVDKLQLNSWDIPVHAIVTDHRWYTQ